MAANLPAHFILHGESDTVQHEPRGLLSHTDSFGEFVTADAVLAVSNQPHGDQPLINRQRRVFHDGTDFDRELPLGVLLLALPDMARFSEVDLGAATGGALHDAIGPAELHHFGKGHVRIAEVNDGGLECFGPVLGCHALNIGAEATCVK